MYEIKLLSFSDRKKLADIFEDWVKGIEDILKTRVKRNPEAVITFLEIQGLIDPDHAIRFIKEWK